MNPETARQSQHPPLDPLSPFERLSFRLTAALASRAVPLTEQGLRFISHPCVRLASYRMTKAHGLDRLTGLRPDQGILLLANHRSYFDLPLLCTLLRDYTPLRVPIFAPVRANFFFQNPLGLLINLSLAGGRMFPPIFREPGKRELNWWSLAFLAERLRRGNVMIGFHPEGTRNKNPDPYTPLPAHPGVGKLVMETWPVVIPAFLNGLSNNPLTNLRANLQRSDRAIAVFGEPVDLSPFRSLPNRMASHKKIADRLVESIYALGEEERRLRGEMT